MHRFYTCKIWIKFKLNHYDGEVRQYPGGPQEEVSFLAVLKEYDKQMGRLMRGLKELGIDENTLVVFTSDNEPLPNFRHDRSAYMRGSKLSLYDGGTKMPFFARWPNHIAPGTVDSTSVICAIDLFLSFGRIGGATIPVGYKSDGEKKALSCSVNRLNEKKIFSGNMAEIIFHSIIAKIKMTEALLSP